MIYVNRWDKSETVRHNGTRDRWIFHIRGRGETYTQTTPHRLGFLPHSVVLTSWLAPCVETGDPDVAASAVGSAAEERGHADEDDDAEEEHEEGEDKERKDVDMVLLATSMAAARSASTAATSVPAPQDRTR